MGQEKANSKRRKDGFYADLMLSSPGVLFHAAAAEKVIEVPRSIWKIAILEKNK